MLDRRFLDVSLVVSGIADSPAANPTIGTQYIVGANPTGDFSGAVANQIARYDGSKWIFSTPIAGRLEVLNAETAELLGFDGTAWIAKTTLGGGAGDTGSMVKTSFVVDDFAMTMPNYYTLFEDGGYHLIGTFHIDAENGKLYRNYNSSRYIDDEIDIFVGILASTTDGKIYDIAQGDGVSRFYATEIPDSSIIYNKRTGCMYIYYKSTMKFELVSRKIHSVDNIVDFMCWNYTSENPQNSVIGEGSLRLTDTALQQYISDTWTNLDASCVNVGRKYVARENAFHDGKIRIYEKCDFSDTGNTPLHLASYRDWLYYDLEVEDYFINKADGRIYYFDGDSLIPVTSVASGGTGGTASTSEVIAPVVDIIQSGEHSNPPLPVAGLKFMDTNEGKVYAYDDSLNLRGVNLTIGDRYALTTDHKIYEYDGSKWTATDVPDGGMFLNKTDKYVYVYDAKIGEFVKASADEITVNETVVETHTLTAAEATAKSFNLTNSIMTGKETDVMLSVCGMVQIAGVDYTASGNVISWDSKTLESIGLQAGDVFVVHYTKA